MAQTKEGAIKRAANKIGVTFEQYLDKQSQGLKWCFKCSSWQKLINFNTDKSRFDGLTAQCVSCRRVKNRKVTKGRISYFKGKTHSDKSRELMSQSQLKNTNRLNKPHSYESRKKISTRLREPGCAATGERNSKWKGGVTPLNEKIRKSVEYSEWRESIFKRDDFTCQHCGDNKGGNLHAHHIKAFADFPELRFELSNGLTLCRNCHEKVHSN